MISNDTHNIAQGAILFSGDKCPLWPPKCNPAKLAIHMVVTLLPFYTKCSSIIALLYESTTWQVQVPTVIDIPIVNICNSFNISYKIATVFQLCIITLLLNLLQYASGTLPWPPGAGGKNYIP